ncbi:hypothetical protein P792_02540 [Asaia sp. SF2.1]|nr:hypothetical protein P792_02540 [Asaia sp. SF2.1]
MAGATEQPDIVRIERRTAVFQFMDMIAEDPAAGTAADLAESPTLSQKAGDKTTPSRGSIERGRVFLREACDARTWGF